MSHVVKKVVTQSVVIACSSLFCIHYLYSSFICDHYFHYV